MNNLKSTFIFLLIVALLLQLLSLIFRIDDQNLHNQLARQRSEQAIFESRYSECLDILRKRNLALLNLRLEYDRIAASLFEKCHSNSFSIEHSSYSSFPRHDRFFAIGLHLDMERIKERLEFEREHSLHPFSLISGGCISSSDHND